MEFERQPRARHALGFAVAMSLVMLIRLSSFLLLTSVACTTSYLPDSAPGLGRKRDTQESTDKTSSAGASRPTKGSGGSAAGGGGGDTTSGSVTPSLSDNFDDRAQWPPPDC